MEEERKEETVDNERSLLIPPVKGWIFEDRGTRTKKSAIWRDREEERFESLNKQVSRNQISAFSTGGMIIIKQTANPLTPRRNRFSTGKFYSVHLPRLTPPLPRLLKHTFFIRRINFPRTVCRNPNIRKTFNLLELKYKTISRNFSQPNGTRTGPPLITGPTIYRRREIIPGVGINQISPRKKIFPDKRSFSTRRYLRISLPLSRIAAT